MYVDSTTISDNTSYGTAAALDLTTSGLTYASAIPNNVTISNSTISGNQASGNGGAFFVYDSNVNVFQSTISGNSTYGVGGGFYGRIACNPVPADGPCYLGEPNEPVFTIDRSTFGLNYTGGGSTIEIFDNTSATITNTIITNSDAPGGSDLTAGGGAGNPTTGAMPMITLDYSLVELDGNGNAAAVGGTGNIIASGNANVGPLQDNGGPTFTHALLSGSQAIDVADPGVSGGTDQRGYGPRDFNGRMDMGAYEYGATGMPPIITDFNGDGDSDIDDLDNLCMNVSGAGDLMFDANGDGTVDAQDVADWLVAAGALPEHAAATGGNPFLVGDSNLDGNVDGPDFLNWNGNKFTNSNTWSGGDFNCDGLTDGPDFLLWNGNKFMSSMSPIVQNDGGHSGEFEGRLRANASSHLSGKVDVERSMAINTEGTMEMRMANMQSRRVVSTTDRTPIAPPAAATVSVVSADLDLKAAGVAGNDQLVGADKAADRVDAPALQVSTVSSIDSIANHDDAEEQAADSVFASLGSEL